MSVSELVAVVAAVASVAATTFAAIELRHSTNDRKAARTADLDGVAVAWHPTSRPVHGDDRGQGTWTYEIVAQNPGRLPIRDVRVELRFGTPVQRVHYDLSRDKPADRMVLVEPVLLGASSRTWKRTLMLPFSDRAGLTATTATIAFTSADGLRRVNHMDGTPPETVRPA